MKSVKGWWFTSTDKKLAYGDNRKIRLGITHKVTGEIIPCKHGLHLSKRIIDALQYASGPVIYQVNGRGTIVPHGNPVDKYACSERTYLVGEIDITDLLWKFARMCALDVIHLWDAPDIVIQYLKTGDKNIMATARDAVWAATRPGATARATAGAAARAATRVAVMNAAWAAARDAAWAGARAADWDAARAKQNRRLTRMVNRVIENRATKA